MIDKILKEIIEKQVLGDDVAILMGGGVDATTLLFTCLRLNNNPHGYSFYIEGQSSYDSEKAEEICKIFDLSTEFYSAANLSIKTSSTEKLVSIVKKMHGYSYLSGLGGDKYQDAELFKSNSIHVIYNAFEHPKYKQVRMKSTIKGLSILDYIYNLGFDKTMILLNNSIAKHIGKIRKNGRNHALIVVAESVRKEDGSRVTVKFIDGEVRLGGIGTYIGDEIYKITNAETRVTVLGHVQRGAQPTHRDRLIASAFGVYAVDLVAQENFNRIVVWQNRGVTDISLDSIAGKSKTLNNDDPLIKVAHGLGIYVGEIN